MSYKDVLRVFKLERELTDNETALLNTLRSMSESERELLAETLGPPVKAKASKVKTTRNMAHCGACDFTRRAAWHKDTNHKDYHEFVEPSSPKPKSARASSLSQAIKGTASGSNNKPTPTLCDYSIDGKVCKGTVNDAIHDESMGYAGYHPFQSAAHNAESSSPTGESGVSSEVEKESVSTATGD